MLGADTIDERLGKLRKKGTYVDLGPEEGVDEGFAPEEGTDEGRAGCGVRKDTRHDDALWLIGESSGL